MEKELPSNAFDIGEAELLRDGKDGSLIAYGALVYPALDVARILEEKHDLKLAVVNARFAKPIDEALIAQELKRQPHVFTLKDHARAGGFGAAVLEWANAAEVSTDNLTICAIEDEWVDHGARIEALAMAGLDVNSLVQRVEKVLLGKRKKSQVHVSTVA